MKAYLVTVRTARGQQQFTRIARSSGQVAEDAAALFDEPCGVTVIEEGR
jgi:hypothetical protein